MVETATAQSGGCGCEVRPKLLPERVLSLERLPVSLSVWFCLAAKKWKSDSGQPPSPRVAQAGQSAGCWVLILHLSLPRRD